MADQIPPVADNLSEADAKYLGELYRAKRYQSQMNFYEKRVEEYKFNADVTFYASSLMMIFTGLLSTFNVIVGPLRWLSVLVAGLPALTALLGAFNQIYDWDRQAGLYLDASARLIRLEDAPITNQDDLVNFVGKAEFVFQSEGDQWGQTISGQRANNL